MAHDIELPACSELLNPISRLLSLELCYPAALHNTVHANVNILGFYLGRASGAT